MLTISKLVFAAAFPTWTRQACYIGRPLNLSFVCEHANCELPRAEDAHPFRMMPGHCQARDADTITLNFCKQPC